LPENERMDGLGSADIFLFEGFRFDRPGGGLFRLDEKGIAAPVALGSRALDLLGLLLARQGTMVSKDEIMTVVWPGTIVEEGNLTVQVSALRRILDRERKQGSCIQTVPGRGYRFVSPVTRLEPAIPPSLSVQPVGHGSDGHIAEPKPPEGQGAPGQRRSIPATAPWNRHQLLRIAAFIGAVALFAVIIGGSWHLPWSEQLRSVPRLSIVVLPFLNLTNEAEQQYFADGITEDVTTDLSRIADMYVISRNTAFTYRNKQVDAKQIGREIGVRYVLEGSVQRAGNQVRVNAQLIDAETATQLWAERFDRDTGNLLALQDDVTNRIAVALNMAVIGAEAARPNDRPDALDYILRGRAAGAKGPARENNDQAVALFEHALALDPQSLRAQSGLAGALAVRVVIGMTDSPAADIARADALINQVLAVSSRDWFAHWVKAQVLRMQRRCDDAIPEYEIALALNRNGVIALNGLGWCKLYTGSLEEVIPLEERAIRLSPRDPAIGYWYGTIGFVYLLQSRLDEAIFWLEKARSALPGLPHYYLISAYALRGDTERAAAELVEARRLISDRHPSISRVKAIHDFGVPKIRALFETTYLAGLRKAGVPED
jgi:TolB-like protein/DNA-binding winged helix-turn-helix (wHTH) protein